MCCVFLCYNTKEVLKMVLILYGFVVAFVVLIVGVFIFFKNQDKFILYI